MHSNGLRTSLHALGACLFLASTAFAQDRSPFPASVFDPGPSPLDFDAGDFDGDGDLDLVIADTCIPLVRVMRNDGHGAFDSWSDVAMEGFMSRIAVADMDGDGDLDAVGIEGDPVYAIVILENRSGTLVPAQRSSLVGYSAPTLALGDLDGDGLADLVLPATAPTVRGMAVFHNAGGVLATPVVHPLPVQEMLTSIALGDYDGDGDLDVSGPITTGALRTWSNDGTGLFVRAPDGPTTLGARILSADLDGDGADDRILWRGLPGPIRILASSVRRPIDLDVGPATVKDVVAADVDGDGVLDLRVLTTAVHDFVATAPLAYAHARSFAVPGLTDGLAVADLDGDGALDWAATNYSVDALVVGLTSGAHAYAPAESRPMPWCDRGIVADLDGDGDLDAATRAADRITVQELVNGVYEQTTLITAGTRHLAVADVIPGGALELVAGDQLHLADVRVLSAVNGLAYAVATTTTIQDQIRAIAVGDVDQDGLVDLVASTALANGSNSRLHALHGRGDGTFEALASVALAAPIGRLALGDVDGDGDLDALGSGDATSPPLVWARNDLSGGFAAPAPIAGTSATVFAASDLDLDGDLDLVVWDEAGDVLRSFRNAGGGAFELAWSAPSRRALELSIARVDGDALPDLVTHESSSPFQTPAMHVTTWTNAGSAGFARSGRHSSGPMRPGVTIADWNGDGASDLIAFGEPLDGAANGSLEVFVGSGEGPVGTPRCSGDGNGSACPCGNAGDAGHGCGSSASPGGALLVAYGGASIVSDSLVLEASGLPSSTVVHFVQSSTLANAGAGVVFGDGLLCVDGVLRRLSARQAHAGVARLGADGGAGVAALGHVEASGGACVYQAIYRNAASFCTSATFNTTNALELCWAP